MNARPNRTGVTARLVIGTLCALFFVPAMLVIGALFSWQRQSQAQSVARRAQAEAVQARSNALAALPVTEASVPQELGSTPTGDDLPQPSAPFEYRPVVETTYENQTRVTSRPVLDPNTGETRMVHETVEVKVPIQTTKFVRVGLAAHGPKVMQLVTELREMDKDEDGRKAKIDEMKALLTKEFQQQHEQQGKEIEQTEQRLEKLKQTHEQRETRQDEIVQRRVDQLTGHPDILQWNPTPNAVPLSRQGFPGSRPQLQPRPASEVTNSPLAGVAVTPRYIPTNPTISRDARGSAIGPRVDAADLVVPQQPRTKVGFPPKAPAVPPTSFSEFTPPRPTPTKNFLPTDDFVPNDPSVVQQSQTFGPGNAATNASSWVRPPAAVVNPSRVSSFSTATTTNGVFELARQLSSDVLAESALRAELEKIAKLHQKHAVTDAELQQHQMKLERAIRQAALARAQWNAMSDRLKRGLQYAEKRCERTRQQADAVRESYKAGEAPMNDVLEAEGAAEKAQQSLDDLQAELEQFVEAEKLIDSSDDDSDDNSETESGTDATGSAPPEAR